jgi:restriction system protein
LSSYLGNFALNWREYQKQAATLFRSLGCRAEVEKIVDGVRGSHEIDVWVTRQIYGLEHHWVVETKHWRRRVAKLHVVALKGIVDDVGADRGILLSSSGFQSGAISMSECSNITLSSLEDMRESIREELERYTLSSLEKKAGMVADNLHALYVNESSISEGGFFMGKIRPKDGVDGNAVMNACGRLSVLENGFRSIRLGKHRIPIRFKEDGNSLTRTDKIGVFLEEASKIVGEAEAVLREQSAKIDENA